MPLGYGTRLTHANTHACTHALAHMHAHMHANHTHLIDDPVARIKQVASVIIHLRQEIDNIQNRFKMNAYTYTSINTTMNKNI